MAKEQVTVLNHLEHLGHKVPPLMTVERTTTSKYLFYLAVRGYGQELNRKPTFLQWSRQDQGLLIGTIEEHSIFDQDRLLVLEGWPKSTVDALHPPKGDHILAETDKGELKTEPYHPRLRRDILKVLQGQLGMKNLSLRALLKNDWSSMRGYEDYESLLRKAKIMGWDEERIGKELAGTEREPMLVLMKRGRLKQLHEQTKDETPQITMRRLTEALADTIHYRILRRMGLEEQRAARELGAGWKRGQDLETTVKALTPEDTLTMTDRLIKWDPLIQRRPDLGRDLTMFGNPIGVRRL